jgi:hypothetical protein
MPTPIFFNISGIISYQTVGGIGEDQFIAKVSDRSQIEATELDFAFDMEKAHFFDVETTKRIR